MRPERSGGVVWMTVFEIITLVLGVIDILIALGMLLIALLTYLDQRDDQ